MQPSVATPRSRTTRAPEGRRECCEPAGQGAVFPDVAVEDLRAADEAAGVEHEAEGRQRAVAALLLRVAAPGLRLVARLAFAVGVGQVVEGDGRLPVEQAHRPVEQVRLEGPREASPTRPRRGGAAGRRRSRRRRRATRRGRCAVAAHGGSRARRPGGPGARRWRRPPPRATRRGRPNCASKAGSPTCSRARRPTCSTPMLRGRTPRNESMSTVRKSAVAASGPLASAPRATHWGGDPLGFPVHGGRAIGHRRRLAGEDLGDAGAQAGPVGRGDVAMASEVEEGCAGARSCRGVRTARGGGRSRGRRRRFVGSGCAVRTGSQPSGRPRLQQAVYDDYGTTFRISRPRSFRINKLPAPIRADLADFDRNVGDLVKLGLGLQHPPCRTHAVHQAFYLSAHLRQDRCHRGRAEAGRLAQSQADDRVDPQSRALRLPAHRQPARLGGQQRRCAPGFHAHLAREDANRPDRAPAHPCGAGVGCGDGSGARTTGWLQQRGVVVMAAGAAFPDLFRCICAPFSLNR